MPADNRRFSVMFYVRQMMNNQFCMTKYFLLLFWGITVTGCHQQTLRDFPISKIEADVTSNAELKLSEYFENFRMIKLPSETIMDEIQRVRYENNRIYISDGKTLFIFSHNGDLISSFNKIGRGPGEYTSITDFVVDGERITILNRNVQILLTYNHSGECLSTCTLGFWAQAISPVVNDSYFFYCGNIYGKNQRHKLRRVKNGQEDALYLPIDKNQAEYLHIKI